MHMPAVAYLGPSVEAVREGHPMSGDWGLTGDHLVHAEYATQYVRHDVLEAPDGAPARVWLDATSEDDYGMFVVHGSARMEYGNMDIPYVPEKPVQKIRDEAYLQGWNAAMKALGNLVSVEEPK